MRGSKQAGFRIAVSVITMAIFGALVVTSLLLHQQNKSIKQSSERQPAITLDTAQLTAATATWNTYNDTGYAVASGLSIKYPPDWNINIPGVKTIRNTTSPTAVINERIIYLPPSVTPKEEWDTCAAIVSAAACGAGPGDKTVSGNESTINGLAAYSATMQNSQGTYQVTVIRGNKPTSNGTPYVEFTITSNDPTTLSAFATVMASATLPN